MKNFFLSFLFLLAPSVVFAFNEPTDFMGIKFWRPITEGSMPECRSKALLVTPPSSNPATREKASSGASKLLAKHEEEKKKAADEYDRIRDLYYEGKVSRADVTKAETALAEAMLRVNEDKRGLAESPIESLFERGKPCWEKLGSDGDSHRINNVAIGGFILDVKAESLDGKLAHVFIVFPQGDYGHIFLTFKERYGAPTNAKTETVQSRIGAKFKNEIFKWEGRRVTITLDKMGFTVDKGTVSYDTDIWLRHSAQKRNDEIKKAAKGL